MAVLPWIVIAALIAVNAFYVAAEFGAVSARRSRIRRMAEDGHTLAGRLLPIVDSPREIDRYIAASQVGITLSSLVLGAYGQARLAPGLSSLLAGSTDLDAATASSTAAGVVLVGLTMAQMVLGELVPKSLALQYPTQSALATVLPMQWSLRAFGPFIALLNGSGTALLRLVGLGGASHRHIHSPQELELLIAESRDGGLLEPEEQIRLHRALRLGLRTAAQVMVPRRNIEAIDGNLPPALILAIVSASPFTRLPVYRGSLDHVVGILQTKDVVIDYIESDGLHDVDGLLRPAATVPQTMPADRLLGFLRERRTHQALVVDGQGSLVGLVTLEDVLSELLGEVGDELKSAPGGLARG